HTETSTLSLHDALPIYAIKARAEKQGVGVQYSEIVGLIPERGLIGAAESVLRLSNAGDHILETKIRAALPAAVPSAGPSLDGWIDRKSTRLNSSHVSIS